MHPLDDLSYSLRRYYVDEFHFRHVACIPRGSTVLDIGGTRIRKRGRFTTDPFGLRVTTVNISDAGKPDIIADGAALPLGSGTFDAVICSEVLEHVPEPIALIDEAYRVLRTGGALYICVPFLHRIHGDPEDYGRYTDRYWSERLTQRGFRILHLERQGGFWAVLTEMLTQIAAGRVTPSAQYASALAGVIPAIVALRTSAIDDDATIACRTNELSRSYTTGFGIVAVKDPRTP